MRQRSAAESSGNDLKVAIAANVDGDGFDVKLYLDAAACGFPDGSIRG